MTKLSSHVYFYPHEPKYDRPAMGYVKGERFSMAIEAGHSAIHVKEFYESLEEAGLKLPDLTAVTHWHWDHTFAMAFVQGMTMAERRTNDILKEISGRDMTAYREEMMRMDRFIAAEYKSQDIKVVPADIVFEEEAEVDLGGVHVRLFHIPSPHCDDCAAALVVEDGVIFIGDSISGPYPGYEATAEERKPLRDALLKEDFGLVVGGHWEVESRESFFEGL